MIQVPGLGRLSWLVSNWRGDPRPSRSIGRPDVVVAYGISNALLARTSREGLRFRSCTTCLTRSTPWRSRRSCGPLRDRSKRWSCAGRIGRRDQQQPQGLRRFDGCQGRPMSRSSRRVGPAGRLLPVPRRAMCGANCRSGPTSSCCSTWAGCTTSPVFEKLALGTRAQTNRDAEGQGARRRRRRPVGGAPTDADRAWSRRPADDPGPSPARPRSRRTSRPQTPVCSPPSGCQRWSTSCQQR